MSKVKFEALMETKGISFEELPQKIRAKIENFDAKYEEYDEADEDSQEEKDAIAALNAMDMGLISEIEGYIAQKEKQSSQQQQQQVNTDSNDSNTPPSTDDSKPSWMFWA
jgi:hypothetical protein